MQLVQQRRALSLSLPRTARPPQSQIAVAQTVGGALRTARVVLKSDEVASAASRTSERLPEVSSTSREAGGRVSFAFRAAWATGSA